MVDKYIAISCKCTTYGRVDFLEETLYSYLNQDYKGKSELLIVNDYPLQTLHFNHPNVRIINLKKTFPMIGMKENFAIKECKYNTIYNSDDDDIFLSTTLDQINTYFPGHQLMHWSKGMQMVNNEIKAIGSLGNCGIIYDKQFTYKILGSYYPLEHEGADMSLVKAIRKYGGKVIEVALEDKDICQGYSWGNGSYHLSGQGAYKEDRDNIIIRHSKHIENLRKNNKIPLGDIELVPKWKRNYKQMLDNFNTKNKTNSNTIR